MPGQGRGVECLLALRAGSKPAGGADTSETAAKTAAAAAVKFPTRTDFLLLKAKNERRTAQYPAAKASLEKALSIDPSDHPVPYGVEPLRARGEDVLAALVAGVN